MLVSRRAPGDFAEVHAEHLRHPPRIGEELPHLLLGTQLALEPGVPPLRAIQASHLADARARLLIHNCHYNSSCYNNNCSATNYNHSRRAPDVGEGPWAID